MLSVLQEPVQHRLVLPLVIRASQHQGVLHPDTHARQMESGINERLSEVQPLSVRMEHIGRAAFLQMLRHALESGEEEVIKLLILHGIILDGQAAGTFEGDAIGRVCHDEVGFPAVHEQSHILGRGGVPAHKAVSAHRPDIAPLHKGGFLQRGGQVKIIIPGFAAGIIRKQVFQLLFVKAGQQGIKVHALQRLDLYPQKLLVPSGVHRHAVVRNDIGFLLSFTEVVCKHTGNLSDAFLLCRQDSAVSSNHIKIPVDDDGIDKAELPQGRAEFRDLLRGMGAGIVHIGNQLGNRHKLHLGRCLHRTSPHSANFSNPPRPWMYLRAVSTISA